MFVDATGGAAGTGAAPGALAGGAGDVAVAANARGKMAIAGSTRTLNAGDTLSSERFSPAVRFE